MTRTIDIPTFQAAIVRNCSPTLAGIKPASLFTYPGTYAHGDGSTATETIAERRARLLNVIAQCNRELDPFGIHLSVLVWRPCGALVYMYRAKSLTTYFADPRAQTALASEGYDTRDLSTCLVHLASRITLASNNVAECACSQTRCALPQQASCRNRLLPRISLRRRARVYRPARRELQGLWSLEGLHECRASACDV